ncbi:MAG: diacylglycerol/lipid kinase family protein, partial [Bradymonadia bacterium]
MAELITSATGIKHFKVNSLFAGPVSTDGCSEETVVMAASYCCQLRLPIWSEVVYTHKLMHYFGGSRYMAFERLNPSQLKTILKSQDQPSMKSDAKIAIILNGNAKRVNQRYADRLKAIAGPNCDVFMTTSMVHADFVVQSVVDEAYDLIITGGGDGTVLHTIDKALRRIEQKQHAHSPKFGVLRLGTGNAIAYHLGSEKPKDNLLQLHQAVIR